MNEPGREISRAILMAPMLISGQSPPPYSKQGNEQRDLNQNQSEKFKKKELQKFHIH